MTLSTFRQRKQEFEVTFGSSAGQQVLADLARFCRAHETCAVPGDRDRTMLLEGRREVFLYIQQNCKLTEQQLLALFKVNVEGEDNG
jgi:hypothetical protein